MNKLRLVASLTIFLFVLVACSTRPFKSEQELTSWLNDSRNGMVLKREYSEVIITSKYLPPEYLTYMELKNKRVENEVYDSILNLYSNARTFLLSFKPNNEEGKGDIMYQGLNSFEEYNERFEILNFQINEFVSLETDLKVYSPVLYTMENTYGVTGFRNVILVFTDPDVPSRITRSSKYDLVFNDIIFETGISHFTFSGEKLNRLPKLGFIK